LFVLASLPVYLFYSSIFAFAVNAPYWDDYDSILNFANNFTGTGLKDKVNLIFSQHNEHRIAFTRLITLASYYLTGKINFRLLVFIGNISLIGLLIIFWKSAAFTKKKFLYFIPVIFILFNVQYWGDIYFATPSISNLYVLLFAFASLYFLEKEPGKYFLFSSVLAMLAAFTSAEGLLVFFAGLPIVIYQKKLKRISLWACVGIACILFYFHGYIKPPAHPSIIDSIFAHPAHTIAYLFRFLGLCCLLPLAAGILFSAYFIYLVKARFYKQNMALISFYLFLFLTGFAAALSRSGFDFLPSRYRIISTLILVLSYLSFMEILPEDKARRIFPVLLSCSILFNYFSYRSNFKYIILQKKYLTQGLNSWQENKAGLSYPDQGRASSIISGAIARGLYSPR
jgi:hypothetical protein